MPMNTRNLWFGLALASAVAGGAASCGAEEGGETTETTTDAGSSTGGGTDAGTSNGGTDAGTSTGGTDAGTNTGGGTDAGTNTGGSSGKLVINEVLANPPFCGTTAVDQPDCRTLLDGDANGDGYFNSTQDEFIELVNDSNSAFDLSGVTVTVEAATKFTFTFPAGASVPAGKAVVVFGGQGKDANNAALPIATSFNGHPIQAYVASATPGTAVLSLGTSANIVVATASGTVIDRFGYTATGTASADVVVIDANKARQSIVRDPDVSGTWKKIGDVAGHRGIFTPGVKNDGSAF